MEHDRSVAEALQGVAEHYRIQNIVQHCGTLQKHYGTLQNVMEALWSCCGALRALWKR